MFLNKNDTYHVENVVRLQRRFPLAPQSPGFPEVVTTPVVSGQPFHRSEQRPEALSILVTRQKRAMEGGITLSGYSGYAPS